MFGLRRDSALVENREQVQPGEAGHGALPGFAYVIAYAGSISSISVSSDLNVAGVLGVGHALTAIVMALFVILGGKEAACCEGNSLQRESTVSS